MLVYIGCRRDLTSLNLSMSLGHILMTREGKYPKFYHPSQSYRSTSAEQSRRGLLAVSLGMHELASVPSDRRHFRPSKMFDLCSDLSSEHYDVENRAAFYHPIRHGLEDIIL